MRSAPFLKKLKHQLWLIQPILQFFSLLALLILFTKCSPLSPSSSRQKADSSPTDSGTHADAAVPSPEPQPEEALKEVPTVDPQLVLEQKLDATIRSIITRENPSASILLQLSLDSAILESLASSEAKSEIELQALLLAASEADSARATALWESIKTAQAQNKLVSRPFLVFADKQTMASSEHDIRLQFSLEDGELAHAHLVLRRARPEGNDADALEAQQQASFRSAKKLVIVLLSQDALENP